MSTLTDPFRHLDLSKDKALIKIGSGPSERNLVEGMIFSEIITVPQFSENLPTLEIADTNWKNFDSLNLTTFFPNEELEPILICSNRVESPNFWNRTFGNNHAWEFPLNFSLVTESNLKITPLE